MTDGECVARAREGDIEAFTELVERHQLRVRAYLGRMLFAPDVVEDVAQEVFLAAYRCLGEFVPGSDLRAWLLGIARHQALIHLRKESRRIRRVRPGLQEAIQDWTEADAEAHSTDRAAEEVDALRRCIERLPAESARLVRQFYFESRAVAEISQSVGRSENAVRMWLFRIREQLRACVNGRGGQPV